MSLDSEKYAELQKKLASGQSPNDEGPYYHHSWWESYKGGIKGKLGGVVIGALVGAVMGAGVAVIIGMSASLLPIAGAFAAAGIAYGAHEFGDIGKITGAVAASQKQAEVRMKSFEDGKFSELKHDIDELKSIVTGTPVPPKPIMQSDESYRTTHYAKLDNPQSRKLVFWKIALIGLAVGMAAGAILASGGLAAHMLNGLGIALSGAGVMTASVAAFGALGASFGINRDIFRRVFDTTDLWVKGLLTHDRMEEQQIATGEMLSHSQTKQPIAPENYIQYPTSPTYHRDRAIASKVLREFDHTRATPQ